MDQPPAKGPGSDRDLAIRVLFGIAVVAFVLEAGTTAYLAWRSIRDLAWPAWYHIAAVMIIVTVIGTLIIMSERDRRQQRRVAVMWTVLLLESLTVRLVTSPVWFMLASVAVCILLALAWWMAFDGQRRTNA